MFHKKISQFRKNLIGKSKSPYPYMESVLEWTGNHPVIMPLFCDFILESLSELPSQPTTHRQAKEQLDQLIKNKLATRSLSPEITKYLNTVFDNIVEENPHCRKFDLLLQYRRILHNRLENEQILENELLCQHRLVIEKNNILEPFNQIYREYFNEDYLLENLLQIYPYAREFILWLDHNKDDSKLLSLEKYQQYVNFIYEQYSEVGSQEHEYITRTLIANRARL